MPPLPHRPQPLQRRLGCHAGPKDGNTGVHEPAGAVRRILHERSQLPGLGRRQTGQQLLAVLFVEAAEQGTGLGRVEIAEERYRMLAVDLDQNVHRLGRRHTPKGGTRNPGAQLGQNLGRLGRC